MSNRQLEERMESERDQAFADALGISLEDYQALDPTWDEDVGNDGTVYGLIFTFEEGSDPEILDKIDGLQDRRWVKIGPM